MQRLVVMMLLVLFNVVSMSSAFRYSRLKPSPLVIYNNDNDDDSVQQLAGDHATTSLLQKLASTSGGAVLPVLSGGGVSRQGKAQRRAMTLGSRLEPVAGELMSPGVKAMRYGKRSQRTAVSAH